MKNPTKPTGKKNPTKPTGKSRFMRHRRGVAKPAAKTGFTNRPISAYRVPAGSMSVTRQVTNT